MFFEKLLQENTVVSSETKSQTIVNNHEFAREVFRLPISYLD